MSLQNSLKWFKKYRERESRGEEDDEEKQGREGERENYTTDGAKCISR